MSDIMDKFWRAPPVTRTIVAAMFVESALVHSRILPYYYVMYNTPWVFQFPPQPWRVLTSFLVTGGGISFLFDLYFAWTYGSGIELNSPRFSEPGSFFVFVCFAATFILFAIAVTVPGNEEDYPCDTCKPIIRKAIKGLHAVQAWWWPVEKALYSLRSIHSALQQPTLQLLTSGVLLGGVIFTSALLLSFIYIFALDNRGKKATFVIFQIPVELLPWAMLTFTLILDGPWPALQQGAGVLAAHSYDFMTRLYPTFQGGRNYIKTPAVVRRYFGGNQPMHTQKAYGTSFRPGQSTSQQQPQPQSRGWTSGFSNSWSGRGAGHRLGGD